MENSNNTSSASHRDNAGSLGTRENLVQWRRPQRPVIFREWYIYHYCNDQSVRLLSTIQHFGHPLEKLITLYFKLWSFTGEAEFYTVFIPTLVWLGAPLDAICVGSMLCMSQYVTGTLKDSVCCPRPPCPPLELRGSQHTHDKEYGFPSTHASHSGVFSYFLYCTLLRFFPTHPVVCWIAAVVYFINVSMSRLYLGMHWLGDLLGGWCCAFLCILFQASFLGRWEENMVTAFDGAAPWWAFVLLYVAFHLIAMAHATPHDPCPCYVDSLRFAGVMIGAFMGFWLFRAMYNGELTARPPPSGSLSDVFFSWTFLSQWLICLVLVVVAKELSSLAAKRVLPVVFKFLSGFYVRRMPRALRKPYLFVAGVIGRTTRGNEHGPFLYVPTNPQNSFALSRTRHTASPEASQSHAERSSVPATEPPTPRGAANTSGNAFEQPVTVVRVDVERESVNNGERGLPELVEEPDGYLCEEQVWSLRTHRHWWLWEVHQRTVSYFITGLFITFVCPVALREWFKVNGAASIAKQANWA